MTSACRLPLVYSTMHLANLHFSTVSAFFISTTSQTLPFKSFYFTHSTPFQPTPRDPGIVIHLWFFSPFFFPLNFFNFGFWVLKLIAQMSTLNTLLFMYSFNIFIIIFYFFTFSCFRLKKTCTLGFTQIVWGNGLYLFWCSELS